MDRVKSPIEKSSGATIPPMTRGARGRGNISGARGRDVLEGPRSRDVLEGGRSRQVLTGPRGRVTGGVPAVLRSGAVLWLDAANSVAGEQTAVNQGSGGTALDARYGSTTGVDTNDPLFLPHTGENYVYFAGAADSELNFQGVAAGSPPTTQPTSWTESLDFMLDTDGVIQYLAGTGSTHYALATTSGNLLDIYWRDTSVATGLRFQSTSPNTILKGNRYRVELSLDLATPGSRTCTCFVSTNGGPLVEWPMTKVTDSANGLLLTVLNDALLGTYASAGTGFAGRVYSWSRSFSGSDADRSFTFDAATDITDAGAATVTITSGQEFTVLRATTGRKTALVTRPIWLFGTDDYLEVPYNALLSFSDTMTMLAVYRRWDPTVDKYIGGAAEASLGPGYFMRGNGNDYRFLSGNGVGSVQVGTGSSTDDAGTLIGHFGSIDKATSITVTADGSTNTTSSSPANNDPSITTATLYLGRHPTTAAYVDMELVGAALWDRALTVDEIAAINSYYGTV